MLTESLTVAITADSRGLESELSRLAGRVAGLSLELSSLTGLAGGAGKALSDLSGAVGSLSRVSGIVRQIASGLASISATPLAIDAQPAIASLGQVAAAAQAAAASVQAVGMASAAASAMSAASGGFAGGGLPGGLPSPAAAPSIPKLAAGGRVEGPSGVDRVPAMLTRGEFVLRESSARRFPSGLLEQLNSVGPAALPADRPDAVEAAASDRETTTFERSHDRETVSLGFGDAASGPTAAAAPAPRRETQPARPLASRRLAAVAAVSPDEAASPMPSSSMPAPPARPSFSAGDAESAPPEPAVQFVGDINVQVTQPIEIGEVLRQLELGRLREQARHA